MDAKHSSNFRRFRRAYFAPPAAQPRRKRKPYALSKWFDVAVVVALAICVVNLLVS